MKLHPVIQKDNFYTKNIKKPNYNFLIILLFYIKNK
jgi:hypothetical protein